MKRMGIGLQLYTLREEAAADMPGTLRKAAQLGCEGVEFAGYGGMSREELRHLLDELGLAAIGSHVSCRKLQEELNEQIEFNKANGSRFIVCPALPKGWRDSEQSWKEAFRFFEEIGATIRETGLRLAYHNHVFEFEKKVDGRLAYDAIFSSTLPETVSGEMDVCWAQVAGQDPIACMTRYKGRIPLIHLKDMKAGEDGNVLTVELGQGTVDLPGVITAASNADVEWLIVEQDVCQKPPLDSVAASMAWLQRHYLSKFDQGREMSV